MIHQYRTGDKILLTSVCKNNAPITDHLKLAEDKRVLILEQLFEDFKLAASKLKNTALNVNQNKLKPDKVDKEYLSIYNVKTAPTKIENTAKTDSNSYVSSGTTETPPHIQFLNENYQTAKQKNNLTPKKKRRKKK